MALTGLDIFKLLPKTNCKKCGKPTCLAFAMALAAKKANLDECPDISDEARAQLEGASAPPMKLVTIGVGDSAVQIGQETVLFRHEEKFHNPCAIAIRIRDDLSDPEIQEKAQKINSLSFERIGQRISVNLIAVENNSGSAERFARAVRLASEKSRFSFVLISPSPENMKAGLEVVADRKPLLYGADSENYEAMAQLAKEKGCPLTVIADGLEALAELTEKVKALGVEDLLIDPATREPKATLEAFTLARRACLKRNFRPLGYPTIAFACNEAPMVEMGVACIYVAKYGGVVMIDGVEAWEVLPILTARQNIYTDPQKPIQVEPGVYAVGEPNEDSPFMFTTNFSLTYYTVEADVEASRVPAWILVVDTEGLSVLTAYSGDKLNEKIVADHLQKFKAEERVSHRKLIIPGYVAVLSGKLEEATGWEILIGPRESSFIPKYLKTQWSS